MNTLCIFGTRPEAIKMAPIIKQMKTNPLICNHVCVTGQHQEMLDAVLRLFDISPDFNLQTMAANQNLSQLTAKILNGLDTVLTQQKPDLVLVHGDTTTTFAASLSAFYHRIPLAHVEAGLRTGNLYLPWPEEANRKLTSQLAHIHFAPTPLSRQQLLREGIADRAIHVTGNTVIDALHDIIRMLNTPNQQHAMRRQFSFLSDQRKIILVTGHRRESFGYGFEQICQALISIATLFPEVDIVYPVHLNPNVQQSVNAHLTGINNIYLLAPVDYVSFVYLMQSAYLILTDSGGIQEEAPALGKPVLIMRALTERPEAITAGTAALTGVKAAEIVNSVTQLLTDKTLYERMCHAQNPFGDGKAAMRIVEIITKIYELNPSELHCI